MARKALIENHGKLSKPDEKFDVLYWSSLSTEERFEAAWELIRYYYKSKGKSRELRLRRNITTLGEMEGPLRNNRRLRGNGTQRAKSDKGLRHTNRMQ